MYTFLLFILLLNIFGLSLINFMSCIIVSYFYFFKLNLDSKIENSYKTIIGKANKT